MLYEACVGCENRFKALVNERCNECHMPVGALKDEVRKKEIVAEKEKERVRLSRELFHESLCMVASVEAYTLNGIVEEMKKSFKCEREDIVRCIDDSAYPSSWDDETLERYLIREMVKGWKYQKMNGSGLFWYEPSIHDRFVWWWKMKTHYYRRVEG